MTTGKIAAQCSHATLGLYKTMVAHHPRYLPEIALGREGEGNKART